MIGLFILSLAACVAGGFFKKDILNRCGSGKARHQLYNCLTSLVAVITLLMMAVPAKMSWFTFGLGIVFGVVTAVQGLALLRALDIGPLSYTTVIVNLSTLIPALSGALIWNERISVVQIVGIVALMVCFVLSTEAKGEQKSKGMKWLAWTLVAFVCTGAIGVMQKWHQSTVYSDELDGFLVVTLGTSTLFSGAALGILALQRQMEKEVRAYFAWWPLIAMILAGVCIALCNKLNLHLAGVMDSAFFYPAMNGGTLIATTVGACILFRERLTKRQWIGVGVGISAVILLSNPFK